MPRDSLPLGSCPHPWIGDDGTESECVEKGHCGCGAPHFRWADCLECGGTGMLDYAAFWEAARYEPRDICGGTGKRKVELEDLEP